MMNQLFASKNKRLRTACFGGSLDTVKALLVDGADLNRGGRLGQTPLHHACRGGHEKIVEYLLNKGADPNVKELNGDTPLHFACRSGFLGVVQRLKAGGAKPGIVNTAKENALDVAGKSKAPGSDECYEFLNADSPTERLAGLISREKQVRANLEPGQVPEGPVLLELDRFEEIVMEGAQMKQGMGDDELTLLHMACAAGVLSFVQLLVSQGSDIHQRTTGGKQALHFSSDYGHYAVSKFLIAQGADVKAKNDEGFTPFLCACTEDKPQTVELLLKCGANLKHTAYSGRNGLHLAAFYGCKDVVAFLLSEGLDPAATCKTHLTAFDYAAASGHSEILRTLIELSGIKISELPVSPEGITMLMLADDAETASLLLKKGADVHQKSADGRTALHFAAQNGKAAVTTLLIGHGAVVDEEEEDAFTPLHFAARDNKAECVSILLSSGANPYAIEQKAHAMPYHHAASSGSSDALKVFIDHKVDLEKTCSKDSQRALHLAAKNNHHDCTQMLLEAHAEIDAQDNDGWTACFYVCKAGHEKILELLLAHDCNIHIESKGSKKSALHVACAEGHVSIVKMLLAFGAKVNAKDAEDWTPLHFAARDSNMELAEVLLGAGANRSLVDDQGRTPEKLAREDCNMEVAEFIANYTVPAPTSGCFFDACAKFADNPPTPLKFLTQLEELTHLIGNVHEAKVFYTIIGGCIRGGLISKEDASFLVKPALETTSITCTSDQAYAIFKTILWKAKSDGFITKQESDCYEARAMSAFIAEQPFIQQMWEEIRKNSDRISLIEGSVEGLQRKVESMQQGLMVLAQQQMYMSDYLRHKQHIEIVVGMVGAVASAISMGVGGCLVSAASCIVDRIVDFGDLDHIQAVLLDASETNHDLAKEFRETLSILEETMVNRLEWNLSSKLADGNILTRITLIAAAHQQGLGQPPLPLKATRTPPSPDRSSDPSPPSIIDTDTASGSSSACELEDQQSRHVEDHPAPMPLPVESICWADAVFDENEADYPIHIATKYGFLDDILLAVQAHPEKLNSKDSKGRTPLCLAAFSGQSDVFRALKEKGAVSAGSSKMKYTMKRREGRSLLFLDRVRSELRQKFPFPVLSDEDGKMLPLHAAIYYADEDDIVEVLKEHQDELNFVDSEGRSAVDIAALTGQPSIVVMLEEIGGCTFDFFGGRWTMRAVSRVQDLRSHLTSLCKAHSSKNLPFGPALAQTVSSVKGNPSRFMI